jgi:hypothetical protein
MSLIPRISSLFDNDLSEYYIDDQTIEITLKQLYYEGTLKICIIQTEKIIMQYIFLLFHDDKILFTSELTDINLDNIINPIFDKQNIINMIHSFNCELNFAIGSNNILSLKLRFEIKENCIEMYKQITSFPEIYYMRLDYDDKSHVLKLFNFMALQHGSPLNEIFAIIVNECETQYYMIKPVTEFFI